MEFDSRRVVGIALVAAGLLTLAYHVGAVGAPSNAHAPLGAIAYGGEPPSVERVVLFRPLATAYDATRDETIVVLACTVDHEISPCVPAIAVRGDVRGAWDESKRVLVAAPEGTRLGTRILEEPIDAGGSRRVTNVTSPALAPKSEWPWMLLAVGSFPPIAGGLALAWRKLPLETAQVAAVAAVGGIAWAWKLLADGNWISAVTLWGPTHLLLGVAAGVVAAFAKRALPRAAAFSASCYAVAYVASLPLLSPWFPYSDPV